jgi:hypothetical protein
MHQAELPSSYTASRWRVRFGTDGSKTLMCGVVNDAGELGGLPINSRNSTMSSGTNVQACAATTVAVRGMPVSSAISPKKGLRRRDAAASG